VRYGRVVVPPVVPLADPEPVVEPVALPPEYEPVAPVDPEAEPEPVAPPVVAPELVVAPVPPVEPPVVDPVE
jgi:hypothetical protein